MMVIDGVIVGRGTFQWQYIHQITNMPATLSNSLSTINLQALR